jgi:hypothetical protein
MVDVYHRLALKGQLTRHLFSTADIYRKQVPRQIEQGIGTMFPNRHCLYCT